MSQRQRFEFGSFEPIGFAPQFNSCHLSTNQAVDHARREGFDDAALQLSAASLGSQHGRAGLRALSVEGRSSEPAVQCPAATPR